MFWFLVKVCFGLKLIICFRLIDVFVLFKMNYCLNMVLVINLSVLFWWWSRFILLLREESIDVMVFCLFIGGRIIGRLCWVVIFM